MSLDLKPAVAELIGTFILVFIGAGAGALSAGGLTGVALAHGVALMVIVYLVGGVSGAHVNPAVTFGVAVSGNIEWSKAVVYWVAQLIGAVLAAGLLLFVLGEQAGTVGATTLASGTSAIQGLTIEAVLTVFLVMAVLISGVLGKNGNLAGVAIGFVLTMDILMGGSLTGASMNPARTLGPAVVSGNFADVWVYVVGPLLGGAVAAGLVGYLYAGE